MADHIGDAASHPIAESRVVTAAQMQAIESAMFAHGMPIAALMEKVAQRITAWFVEHYPSDRYSTVGIIVGPGHNGGDALVIARELYHHGYQVLLWCPFETLKALTAQHKAYAEFLGINCTPLAKALVACDVIVDGGFGVGLTRPLSGEFAQSIEELNHCGTPVISIDLPSGLDTDTGKVLGVAVKAQHTLCLGAWKLGLLQDQALPWIGTAHLIPFDIPISTIQTVLAEQPAVGRLDSPSAIAQLPLPRSPLAHKYTAGHALLIAGSQPYVGAALLAGKGAKASGVGMLTIVVPAQLKPTIASQLPEALIVAAPETAEGTIAELPTAVAGQRYDVVACGPGLTQQIDAVMQWVLASDCPVVLDADGLNWLAQAGAIATLRERSAPTLLTPHPGEFRRLFPDVWEQAKSPTWAAQAAAQAAHCGVILKGARTVIAAPDGRLWINPESTPALARGGSGDVLTGLIVGLAAQHEQRSDSDKDAKSTLDSLLSAAIAGVWWHAQTGRAIAAEQTVLGCSATHLAETLLPTLAAQQAIANMA